MKCSQTFNLAYFKTLVVRAVTSLQADIVLHSLTEYGPKIFQDIFVVLDVLDYVTTKVRVSYFKRQMKYR